MQIKTIYDTVYVFRIFIHMLKHTNFLRLTLVHVLTYSYITRFSLWTLNAIILKTNLNNPSRLPNHQSLRNPNLL